MIVFLVAHLAYAGIAVDPPPTVGIESEWTLTDADGRALPGQTLRVTVRHGLPGEQELGLGITDARGRVRHTPTEAGPAEIRANDGPIDLVRIARRQAPASTLAPWIVVALAGLGALIFGTRRRRF